MGALLGFAQRFGGPQERVDVARVAFDLVHPERLELIELFFLNQRIGLVRKRHGRGIVLHSKPLKNLLVDSAECAR